MSKSHQVTDAKLPSYCKNVNATGLQEYQEFPHCTTHEAKSLYLLL